MTMNIKRRIFLKGSLAASATGVALGAGLLTPTAVLAEWPKAAFTAKKLDDAMNSMFTTTEATESADITVKAPEIAENGAVVPVKITVNIADTESIAVIASNNPVPMIANYILGEGAESYISTRIKMGKTGDVMAIVKAGGKLYKAGKEVKVTIGGCGG